jgi:hypothetical protein
MEKRRREKGIEIERSELEPARRGSNSTVEAEPAAEDPEREQILEQEEHISGEKN